MIEIQIYIGSDSNLHFSLNSWKSGNACEGGFTSPEDADWYDLAENSKAQVEAEIKRRKDQYQGIREVKIGLIKKANALKEKMKNDILGPLPFV